MKRIEKTMIAAICIGAGALAICLMLAGCVKSDAEIAIDATRQAEATVKADETAAAISEDALARDMIVQVCDVIEERFRTDRELSSISVKRMQVADEWLYTNAEPESEIAVILDAFMLDVSRVHSGEYASWAHAFQVSGSKYVSDCAGASWRR